MPGVFMPVLGRKPTIGDTPIPVTNWKRRWLLNFLNLLKLSAS